MTRSRSAVLLGAVAAGAVAVPAAAVAGSTSSATLWQDSAKNIACGVAAYPAKTLLCSARDIPAPPHTTNKDGDPGFVTLGAAGKPKPIRTSQYSFKNMSDKFKTLAAGTKWSLNGVTCSVAASTVTCTNGAGHGFTAGSGKYKSF